MTQSPDSLPQHPDPVDAEPEPGARDAANIDPLSDVLRMVRLTGAVFFLVDASPTWIGQMPSGTALAPALLPRSQRVISYHVVTRGSCWGRIIGGDPVELGTGDVVVFPHGDAYCLSVEREGQGAIDPEQGIAFLRGIAARRFPFVISDGLPGDDRLGLVCGFLGCDVRPFNPLLAALPPLLVVRRSSSPGGDRLDRLVELTLNEAREDHPGGECVRLHLSELMFVEVVRRHLATQPPQQAGWLAGLKDPMVGRAIALLHERPAHDWSLQGLARDAGASRSVLADRFTRLVGLPPMMYLTRWRMQVAARLLSEGMAKVAAVGLEIGYDSEAAFSRAFKKETGVPPREWRQRSAG